MRQTRLITLVVALVLLAPAWIYFYPKWERFWEIDGCYDRGGWWRDDAEVCEYCVNGDGSPAPGHPLCERDGRG